MDVKGARVGQCCPWWRGCASEAKNVEIEKIEMCVEMEVVAMRLRGNDYQYGDPQLTRRGLKCG
jgi:hypothetical protein